MMRRVDVAVIIKAMREQPDDFERTEYVLLHKPSRHEIWIANGRFFYGIYRCDKSCHCKDLRDGKFSFWGKLRFGFAYRRWRRRHEKLYGPVHHLELARQFGIARSLRHNLSPVMASLGDNGVAVHNLSQEVDDGNIFKIRRVA
jgi:hypothetical protein